MMIHTSDDSVDAEKQDTVLEKRYAACVISVAEQLWTSMLKKKTVRGLD